MSMIAERERIINNYVAAYNAFDVAGMVQDLDEAIVFENVSNGATTLSLKGIDAFTAQAEAARAYFIQRTQKIQSIKHRGDEAEVEIAYDAVLAMDFPNGLKKGDLLMLQGRSIFKFNGNKITALTDIS